MLTDAHCHPFDLVHAFPQAEQERRNLGVLAAASACTPEEFLHNEALAYNAAAVSAVPLLPCFGLHPQLPAVRAAEGKPFTEAELNEGLEYLHSLAQAGKIAAVGECGFDLYNAAFKETEAIQDRLFSAQVEISARFDLPLVIHVRRAMHKIFNLTELLLKRRAVIFHSWSGTFEEAQALMRRGVNAYFSFGNVIALNHKQAIKTCTLLPIERLLTETDAPFQPRRGMNFSQWADLPLIIETAAKLRCEAGNKIDAKNLSAQIEKNFRAAFGGSF